MSPIYSTIFLSENFPFASVLTKQLRPEVASTFLIERRNSQQEYLAHLIASPTILNHLTLV